jgi:hypothetical protein
MPNLHGLASLVCLIFAPSIELRYGTFLVALCCITWERKILRKVHGAVTEQGVWRIRTNQEQRELYKTLIY